MEFKAITNALESLSVKLNLPRGKYNIYCNEPESKEGKTFFNKVYSDNEKSFNLYTLDKLDDVINQLESTEYIKFSEYLKEINL
jgi:Fic family protein